MNLSKTLLAVLLHDGAAWHAHVFAFARPQWRSIARMHSSGGNSRRLPEPLLDFAEHHGARRVRLVVPQSSHVLNTELPPDAEPEELQTAMAFELAGETAGEFDMLRVAAARGRNVPHGSHLRNVVGRGFRTTAARTVPQGLPRERTAPGGSSCSC